MTGVSLPEAQPARTSDYSHSELHVCQDLDDALKQDLTYMSTLKKLREGNEANFSSVLLSEITTASKGANSEDLVIKMIEMKDISGGLKLSYTGDTISLEKAFHCGLIPASVYVNILEKQKNRQDLSNNSAPEKVSLWESVQRVEPFEVNGLLLKCLDRNMSLTTGREIHKCRTSDPKTGQNSQSAVLSSQSQICSSDSVHNGDRLMVDEAIQCDLMSCSSTLIVLANQQQCLGLVLPHAGEIQTVSTLVQYDQQIITSDFTSRLLSNRQKIVAFYIPDTSEVVDITCAIQKGFIDTHTAEVLTSIEFPDVFPDVDHLNAKFSSWLTFKELTIDGCHHAVDGLLMDSNINNPSPSEARHLFISYLMMNSYMDPKSGQRIFILDNQSSEMTKIFLKDTLFVENTEQNLTSLGVDIGDFSEQADLETPLHINEETDDSMKTERELHSRGFGSWDIGRMTSDEEICATESVPQHEPGVSEKAMFQNNAYCTWSSDCEERTCANGLDIEVGGAVEGLEISPETPETAHLPSLCPVNTTNGSLSTVSDSKCAAAAVKSCHQTQPHFNADTLCSKSEGTDNTTTELLCSEGLWEGGNERDRAIHLLRGQIEEGGILDVTSGKRYDLEAALDKGLVDEETTLELLALQLHEKRSVLRDDAGILCILKQSVSDGFLSSNIALQIMEQQSLIVGVHDSRTGCTISISEALQSGLVSDECVDKILNSDPKATIYPEERCSHGTANDKSLGLIDIDEAESSEPAERKVAVMVLDVSSDEIESNRLIMENGGAVVDGMGESIEEMNKSNYLHFSIPSLIDNRHECTQMTSSISLTQVTDECIHPADGTSALTKDCESQVLISAQLTFMADVCSGAIQNAAQSTKSHSSSLSDGMPDSNTERESQTSAIQSCSADCIAIDNDFHRGRYFQVGNQSISQSNLDMSSSHGDIPPEDNAMENDTSAVQSPLVSEPAQSIDHISPRDLVENTYISVSVANGGYDQIITEDCSSVTLPQPTVLQSECDFSTETDSRFSQNGQSFNERTPQQLNHFSQSPALTNEITTSNTIEPQSYEGEVTEHYTQTTLRVSPEPTPTFNNSVSGSKRCAADNVESSKETLSSERQNGQISSVTSEPEQISVSTTLTVQTSDNEPKTSIVERVSTPPSASDTKTGQSETELDILSEKSTLHVCASVEGPQVVADILLHTCVTADVGSSAPSNGARMDVDDQEEISAEQSDISDVHQNSESTITEIQNTPPPSDRDGFDEINTSRSDRESSHPHLLVDLLQQDPLILNNKETVHQAVILQEGKVHDQTELSDVPSIPLQLQQVLKSISSSQDPSVLQDIVDTLSSTLAVDSQEDQCHIREDIKDESSEEESDGSTEGDADLCHSAAVSPQSSTQTSAESDGSVAEDADTVVNLTSQCETYPLPFMTDVTHAPLSSVYSCLAVLHHPRLFGVYWKTAGPRRCFR